MSESLQISDEKRSLLLERLRQGATRSEACEVAGVDQLKLEAWLSRGANEPPEEPFAALADDVEMAEAQATCEAQLIIHKIATGKALEPHERERLAEISPALDWRDIAIWIESRLEAHARMNAMWEANYVQR
jgi:hypothetical protein